MAKTRQFNIRLDEETLGEIEAHPLCKYESVSTVVRHLLRIGLKAERGDSTRKAERTQKEAAHV
jgi:Arc/MetJ-type ribon-helix-helix transcriptional regulator